MEEKTEERFIHYPLGNDPLLLESWAMERSGIQNVVCFRALSHARHLAQAMVDEEGCLRSPISSPVLSYYCGGSGDSLIVQHCSHFLHRWNSDPAFVKKFQRFSLPLCHYKAEQIIREALQLSTDSILTDAHVRRAAISACLTPLRQSIGSCFATAPAILVQRDHLDSLVDDLHDLLFTGRLRRVVEGHTYTVPLSLSWGVGDLHTQIDLSKDFWCSPGILRALERAQLLFSNSSFETKLKAAKDIVFPVARLSMSVEELLKKVVPPAYLDEALMIFKSTTEHALLKTWEFTLASFSDIKMEFSNWNLSSSLGFHHLEKGGIGEVLYQALDEKLQETHRKIEEYHAAVLEASEQLKMAESLLGQASTEQEMRRLKAEGLARLYHLRACEEMRDGAERKAHIYTHFFSFLIRHYTQKFPDYFQEIYDPEMPDLMGGPYEDRRAGFRLVYKHGRSDSSLWTQVQDSTSFIQTLVEFFTSTESLITYSCETIEEKKVMQEMTTLVLQHVQSKVFLSTTLSKAAQFGRLPWAYLSGGSMDQLIPVYFRLASPLKKEVREVHDTLDLFVFLLETLKALPPLMTDRFIRDPLRGLLMQSPTHAFSLLPGLPFFQEGWLHPGFTYTWIRDRFILPGKQFYDDIQLSREEQREVLQRLGLKGDIGPSMSISQFCSQFPSHEGLASFLYQTLPLIPSDQCKATLQALLSPWRDDVLLPSHLPPFLSSQEIQLVARGEIAEKINCHALIAERARTLKLAPTPCLFADTNWPNGYFAFVIQPITQELEVWKTDYTGLLARPIPLIQSWLGKGQEFTWTLYVNKI